MESVIQNIVPIISILTPMVAGVAWFARLEVRQKNNHDMYRSIEVRVTALEKDGIELIERVARIETKVDMILSSITGTKKN